MSDDSDRDSPPSKGRRFLEMAKMTASVAGDYTASRVKSLFQSEDAGEETRERAQRRNGERVAETLGELKGAAMKIGQMASVATDLLPEEVAEPLEELQEDAPPMPYEAVADQIESELGAPPPMLFDAFEREPFASASIGQVHRATTDDGRDVVVKVQYPGIDDSVSSDIAHLRRTLKVSGFVNRDKQGAFDQLFDEIEARLHEELDYTNEAENVRLFRDLHADDERVVVPEVVGERSAKRVLTLTEERGDSLDEVCDSYAWAEKDAVGETLFRMFASQLFEHETIHADPNPANFAFHPNGTVVLYDFGCIKKLADDQARALVAITRSAFEENWEALEAWLLELGARIPDRPPVPDDTYALWWRIFMEPVLEADAYDYGDGTIIRRFRDNWDSFLEHEPKFQPPPGGVYIDRTIVGLHSIFRQLECQIPVEEITREYLERAERRFDEFDPVDPPVDHG